MESYVIQVYDKNGDVCGYSIVRGADAIGKFIAKYMGQQYYDGIAHSFNVRVHTP